MGRISSPPYTLENPNFSIYRSEWSSSSNKHLQHRLIHKNFPSKRVFVEGRSSSLKFWTFLRCRSVLFWGYKSLYQIQGNTPLGYQPAQVCCKNRETNSKFISWTITLIGKLVERTPPKTRRFFRLTFKKNPTNPWNIPQVSQRSKNEGFLRVRGILVDWTAFNNPQVPGWAWRKCTPRGVVRSQSWFHHGPSGGPRRS